jgi:predicted alpha/beta-fold hydrolase
MICEKLSSFCYPAWDDRRSAKLMTIRAGRVRLSRPSLRFFGAHGAMVGACLLLVACHSPIAFDPQTIITQGGDYDFPIANPYMATVAGTPGALAANLPEDVPVRNLDLTVFEDRKTPDIFWYEDRFRYSIAAQRGEAPLIFIIAGTNAGFASRYSRFLQDLFYKAGFHAVSLSSPTFPNFMVRASTTGVPGRTSQDAADLYRVMQLCMQQLQNRIQVSDIYLTGYSLGGWQSAFIARLDDQQKALGFRRVLMINPPVSLYKSSQVLDDMLANNIPGGLGNFRAFLDEMTARVAEILQRSRGADFSQDFLYDAIYEMQTSDQELRALVGIVFRLAAANIAFTGDVLNNAGYLVPSNTYLTVSTSLTPYFNLAIQRGFRDYLDNLLYPVYHQLDPSITPADLIDESSLESIEPYLHSADNIRLLTNADDIVLAPGDIEFFERTFNGRSRIFPTGGHCGNMRYRYVAATMLRLLLQ